MTVAEPGNSLTLSLFERNLKQALRLYDQPERLGAESALASAYMLGQAIHSLPRPVTARDRGGLLQAMLRTAAARLWGEHPPATRAALLEAIRLLRRDPDHPRYSYLVLELRCFHQHVTPNRMSDIWEHEDLLLGSKSQHYRDFDLAVKRLAPLLLDALRPSVRPEQPQRPAVLYDYDRQLVQVVQALTAGQTVALTGPGGVGKTSLAAMAITELAEHPSFWYTIRPGLNAGLGSLLSALGSFLHGHGASNLWQYLLTTNGVIGDLNLVTGLVRQDLANLAGNAPILCFDDLEHVLPTTRDHAHQPGARILDVLEALHAATPMLLISQRPLPACDLHLGLPGLTRIGITRLWQAAGHTLTEATAQQLFDYTAGNARMVTMLLTLQETGESLDLVGPQTARTLLPAFQRLWQRLSVDEQRGLQRLAVHRGYAPEDMLAARLRDSLSHLKLLDQDQQGGIAVIPAVQPIILEEIPAHQRTALHQEAATIYLERGEYTIAAYHYIQAGDSRTALQVWFPQRQYALARGDAEQAHSLFTTISPDALDQAERKALALIRAELRQYLAEPETGLRELEQADWSDTSEATARLWMLRGELQDALGYPDQAITSYSEGIHVVSRLIGQLVALHHRSGLLHNRQRDLKRSWMSVYRAEFELEVLRGLLLDEEGDYDQAIAAFERAGAQADRLDDDTLRAQSERWLAIVYGRREQLTQAIEHATRSIAIYERLGDRLNLEKMRSNLASIYNQSRAYAETMAIGTPAYAFFLAIGDQYYAAATAANLAEASYQLGNLEAAERYANEVIALEQPFALPYVRFTLGEIGLHRDDTASAITNFMLAMQLATQNEDRYMASFARRSLGEAYRAAGQMAEAEHHIRTALEEFRHLGIPSEIDITEKLLAAFPSG